MKTKFSVGRFHSFLHQKGFFLISGEDLTSSAETHRVAGGHFFNLTPPAYKVVLVVFSVFLAFHWAVKCL